jgi:dephospho-CoA kinase
MSRMLRLGITGGIACGKSVVSHILRELGFPVMDADAVAHQVMEPGRPAFQETVSAFGRDVLGASGNIDRAKLGALVFADRGKREKLNAIVHPRVEADMNRIFEEWERNGTVPVAFVEAALIVEAGYQKGLDGLLVAWCRPDQQLQRLMARGLTDAQARARIASQMPIEEKLRYATEMIDCSGTLEETRRQVEKLAQKLRATRQSK